MRQWATGAVLAVLSCVAGAASAQVDLEPYLRRDGFGELKISPDGRHYAATLPMEDRVALAILSRADKKIVSRAIGEKGSEVADFWWASDSRVVVAMAERLGSRDQPYPTGELFALDAGGETVRRLVGHEDYPGIGVAAGVSRVFATVIDPLPDDPRKVLIATSGFSANPETRIEELDVYTGRRRAIAHAPVRRASFVLDASRQVRFAVGPRDDNQLRTYHRENADAPWTLINDESVTGLSAIPLGFARDGVTAYLQVERAEGPDAIEAYDTRTGARTPVQRDEAVDPYARLLDRDGHLAALQYMHGGVRTRFFDETLPLARDFRRLEKAFPGDALWVTSFTRDGGLVLFQVRNDRLAGDYYLYDTRTRTASGVFARQQWFDPAKMATTRAVALKARDGLALHGYLTVPRDDAAGPRPLVVLPHGGPFGIFDEWAYDEESQLLAEAGYAVLRINFRGSGNYGEAFRQAGAREWGGRMQDDLTDATRWAVEHKVADPSRICLYGASYGGYAALMGVAREPSLYRCAVGYVGVYDLETHHRNLREARWMRTWADGWIGERDQLAARSPINHADRVRVPVLLVAGGEDRIAPIEHSRSMERALRKAGVPVETLYVASEGHGFHAETNRREYYRRLLGFLSRHLGGAAAKVDAKQ